MTQNTESGLERMPPCDLVAEQALIGACLVSSRAIEDAMSVLCVDDRAGLEFYHAPHAALWRSIVYLHESGHAVDQVTICDRLKATGELDAAGGLPYIIQLMAETATGANAEFHARLVKKAWIRRKIIENARAIALKAYDETDEPDELLEQAEQQLADLALNGPDELETFDAVLSQTLDHIEQRFRRKGQVYGIRTGFGELDYKTGGLEPGQMVVFAARPSVGKTSLALVVADRASRDGKRVGIFSLEMPKVDVTIRHLSVRSKIPLLDLRAGRLTDDDWTILTSVAQEMSTQTIMIDDRAGISMSDIRVKCKRWQRDGGLDLVIIDYMGLIAAPKAASREQEVSKVSYMIKNMARELGVAVIVLCQLNRKPEQRVDRRPELSDLRDSGSVEQDSDVVVFISRPEMNNLPEIKVMQNGSEMTFDSHGMAELIVAKNRNGPTGSIMARWNETLACFSPYLVDTHHQEAPFHDNE